MTSSRKKENFIQGFQKAANDTEVLEFTDQGLEDYSKQLLLAETCNYKSYSS